jgi:hypothetical protein
MLRHPAPLARAITGGHRGRVSSAIGTELLPSDLSHLQVPAIESEPLLLSGRRQGEPVSRFLGHWLFGLNSLGRWVARR